MIHRLAIEILGNAIVNRAIRIDKLNDMLENDNEDLCLSSYKDDIMKIKNEIASLESAITHLLTYKT
ncbi:MAG: hypothetical protein ABI241_00700 [Bacteroidia bacterium]